MDVWVTADQWQDKFAPTLHAMTHSNTDVLWLRKQSENKANNSLMQKWCSSEFTMKSVCSNCYFWRLNCFRCKTKCGSMVLAQLLIRILPWFSKLQTVWPLSTSDKTLTSHKYFTQSHKKRYVSWSGAWHCCWKVSLTTLDSTTINHDRNLLCFISTSHTAFEFTETKKISINNFKMTITPWYWML